MAFNWFGRDESQPKKSVVDLVVTMRAAGQTNDQISQGLQHDGYSTAEIYDAVQIADTHASLSQPITESHMSSNPENPMNLQPQSTIGNDFPPYTPQPSWSPPQSPSMGMNNVSMMPRMPMPQAAGDEDVKQIEALIEAIIEEKWKDIEKNISKVVEWKEATDQLLQNMLSQISEVRSQVDSLQKAIIGKVSDYDKNILEVGAQLNAMEKAFSQVLPTFTENINELGRITQRLKK